MLHDYTIRLRPGSTDIDPTRATVPHGSDVRYEREGNDPILSRNEMGSGRANRPGQCRPHARYAKSSGNRHDDVSHDGGQDNGRRANGSGTLGGIVQARAGTIDRRRLWTSRPIDGHSLPTAVTNIGLRGPLRNPFVLAAQAGTTQITIAGLRQTCYPATEGPGEAYGDADQALRNDYGDHRRSCSPIIIIYGFLPPPRSVVDGHRDVASLRTWSRSPHYNTGNLRLPFQSAAPRDARPLPEETDTLTELDVAGQYIYTVQGGR